MMKHQWTTLSHTTYCFLLLLSRSQSYLQTIFTKTQSDFCISSTYYDVNNQKHISVRWMSSPLWSSPRPASINNISRKSVSIGGKSRTAEETKEQENDPFHQFTLSLQSLASLTPGIQSKLLDQVQEIGFESSAQLSTFAADFIESKQPEKLSSVFINDFGLNPLHANYLRAALIQMNGSASSPQSSSLNTANNTLLLNDTHIVGNILSQKLDKQKTTSQAKNKPGFKSIVVNPKAKLRQQQRKQRLKENSSIFNHTTNHYEDKNITFHQKNDYGLPNHYSELYPKLAYEMDEFYNFMTSPMAVLTQEPPIRKATADVYIRHAKLFFGWYLYHMNTNENHHDYNISIYDIIPNKDPSNASLILEFILFLRNERHISASYEANVLRGLLKFIKFRFAKESQTDNPSLLSSSSSNSNNNVGSNSNTFDDIPIINELRKLHRDANKKQILSPRVSEEKKKWLDWEEYLDVIIQCKKDLLHMIQTNSKKYFATNDNGDDLEKTGSNAKKIIMRNKIGKKIAKAYQRYLILAFFSCVPDRQRTIRELELGKTFYKIELDNIKDDDSCIDGTISKNNAKANYVIKHGPDDYKTGKAYGDRPPLVIESKLTSAIDEFISDWRKYLKPTSNHLFVQSQTGKPLTSDSIYHIVSRTCYKYAGKRTNPHLIRDMIVTHIRQSSNASEKELEALALYMGHSIKMQRDSYDRRTMEQKVAPAVELLQNINTMKKDLS